MRIVIMCMLLSACALEHQRIDIDSGIENDGGLCLLDVPCWCVIYDTTPQYAHCHHDRVHCEAERAATTLPTEPCTYEGAR